ncbi:glycogen debranching N-terminal domain-containing protein [Micromonospora sp. NPDC048830]|uniref:amylo-alpha-1,6-glucosidase n=1 Tax=Micromonospora sp. NPDC048830 TaxID=3364257 RepID=UPI003715EC02
MPEEVRLLDGRTFAISNGSGDIRDDSEFVAGLFSLDTRFLSRWELTVDNKALASLSRNELQYWEVRFFLTPGPATQYIDSKVSVIRERSLGGSKAATQAGSPAASCMTEKIVVINHGDKAIEPRVRIDTASDFADIFDAKGGVPRERPGTIDVLAEEDCLRLIFRRGNFRRETEISASGSPRFDKGGLEYLPKIAPGGSWTTEIQVGSYAGSSRMRDFREAIRVQQGRVVRMALKDDLQDWLNEAPKVDCPSLEISATYMRSMVDLAALRFPPLSLAGRTLPAAGLPWFMTIFGRDSIFTSLQALPFVPELAASTLRQLALDQGVHIGDFRDEEPGKILHEVRYGETAAFEEQPHSPYYGSVDATPLFVILLDEYERWTGDGALVKDLEYETRAALSWIDDYADLVGNGYLWYERRNTATGLENQCWKDSWDSLSYSDGGLPDYPRSTCEVQGYAYDAKLRGARLARVFWGDSAYAEKLERDAKELRDRFNREWWLEDDGYFALAMDPEGRLLRVLSSNIGHLLWSGIVDDEKASQLVHHLMGTRLFNGWGIRTLAEGEVRYNPIGYHVGTVWPFDNSIIALGLRRYGFAAEAATIAEGMFTAARYFNGRLPEAFAGYDRSLTDYPVEYPTACSPQAWSTGASLLLLQTMLGMEPRGNRLTFAPVLPAGIDRLEIHGIRGRWGRIDAIGRGGAM